MKLIQNMGISTKYENQDDYNGMLREFPRSQQEENSQKDKENDAEIHWKAMDGTNTKHGNSTKQENRYSRYRRIVN